MLAPRWAEQGPKVSHSSSSGFWNWGRPADTYRMAPGVLSLAPLHWSEELGPRLSLVQAVFPVAWCAGAPHAGACRVSDTARGSQFRCRRAGRRGQWAGRWGQWAGRRGQLPGLMRFKGGRLQNGRWLSPRVCGTRRSPKRLLPVLRPQGELQLPPASPGDFLRPTGGSDPENFHVTASDLGPEHFPSWVS